MFSIHFSLFVIGDLWRMFLHNIFFVFLGGISQKQLVLYKNSTFIKQVTTYCSSIDEDISLVAKKLLYSIDENLLSEIDLVQSVEDKLQIID